MWLHGLQAVAGLGLLVICADWFIDGAVGTAARLGLSPLITGLIIVGIGTSAPELVVSGVAAWGAKPSLALGNAIGSNIANISLVLGVTALIFPFSVRSRTLRREFVCMLAAMVLALLLMMDGHLTRPDGAAMIAGLILMLGCLTALALRIPVEDPLAGSLSQLASPVLPASRILVLLFVGLAGLLGGAELLVRGASGVARAFGVTELVIGLTIVAVGTSLPELAASVASALKRRAELVIGNIIGSNAFNVLGAVGVTAAIHPFGLEREVLTRDYPIMALLTLLMTVFVFWHSRNRAGRAEGGFLLTVFIAYQVYLYRMAIQ